MYHFFCTQPAIDATAEDRFATLRPAQFVARQLHEHQGSDAYREQLQVYKRLADRYLFLLALHTFAYLTHTP